MRAHLINSETGEPVPFTSEELAFRQEFLTPVQFEAVEAASLLRVNEAAVGPSAFPVHGRDISSYQPIGAFGPYPFGISKVSEGDYYTDPHFAGNRDASIRLGHVAFGHYMFARPTRSSPEAAFALVRRAVGAPRNNEFFVCDMEVAGWDTGWLADLAWLARDFGYRVRPFYSAASMLAGNPTGPLVGPYTGFWSAAYGQSVPSGDRMPRPPFGGPDLWQFTDNDQGCDCSAFYGSLDDMRSWIGASPAPAPLPPPPPPTWKRVGDTPVYYQ